MPGEAPGAVPRGGEGHGPGSQAAGSLRLSQPVLSFVRHPAVACTIGTCTGISLDLEEVTL